MKKLVAFLLVIVSLTACSNQTKETEIEEYNSNNDIGVALKPFVVDFKYKTEDGRTVICIWADGSNKGGLWCDWVLK